MCNEQGGGRGGERAGLKRRSDNPVLDSVIAATTQRLCDTDSVKIMTLQQRCVAATTVCPLSRYLYFSCYIKPGLYIVPNYNAESYMNKLP